MNFPNAPATNQTFTFNDKTWRFNGTAWVLLAQNTSALEAQLNGKQPLHPNLTALSNGTTIPASVTVGGTLNATVANSTPLTITRTDSAANINMRFSGTGGLDRWLGITAAGTLRFGDNANLSGLTDATDVITRTLLGTADLNATNLTSGTLPIARLPAFTGDVTTTAGTAATTLATVNSNVGSFGSAAAVPIITVNGKGLITAVSTAALGTAATRNTGTSGTTVPLLDGNNTWSGTNAFSAKVTTAASATGAAGFALPHGAAPTTPVNGDLWTTTASIFARMNGTTRTVAFTDSDITGSAATLTTSRNFSISGGGITAAAVGFNGSAAVVLSASVDNGHISLARMANLPANTIIGNNTGASAVPLALTAAQTRTLLTIDNVENKSSATIRGELTSANVTTALGYVPINPTEKGAANGVATLGSDSKIPVSQLPALAITQSFVVASQAAQLALTAQEGDVAIRSDLSKSFIHNGGSAGTMADWNELLAPEGGVTSVNGMSGAVTITTITGNAGTATALQTGRTIAMTGDVAWTSASFNGSANVTGVSTLATVNSNVGAFGSAAAVPIITVNAKGLVTAVSTAALGTAAAQNTGTSGATIPFLNGNNTWSGTNTYSAKVTTAASATGGAGLALPHGAAPTSPVNGDIWTTTTAIEARMNGATRTVAFLDSNITGSAASLTTARTIGISGPITGTATSFNGSANITIPVTALDVGHANVTGTLGAARLPAFTGDVTTTAGTAATTLATVNSNVGSFGSAAAVPIITVNGKGLITAVSTAALGTAAAQNTGTSGATIPFLNGNNTWSGTNTYSAKVTTAASATGAAGFALPHGAAPTTPVNGDLWTTTTAIEARMNGATRTLAFTDSNITGSAASLTTARTIGISGPITGTATSFNGTANITIPVTALDVGHANVTGTLAVLRGGTGTTTATGTGSVVLSASPTLTGTLTVPEINVTAGWSATVADIALSGATGNWIGWNTNGAAAPAFSTRSAGSKLVLYPNIGASAVDYALGIEANTLWYSVPTTSSVHRWYGGTTSMMTLTNNNLSVTGTISANGNQVFHAGNLVFGTGLTYNSGTGTLSAAGSGGTAFLSRTVATSNQTSFTLPETVDSANAVIVTQNGIRLDPSVDYTVTGTALTLTTGAIVGDIIIAERSGGNSGPKGDAATVAVGTVSTGAAGSSATITNVGTSTAAVLNFAIPRGDTGLAATIALGTVSTGNAGTNVAITNSGNSGAAVFNFTIPRGDTGSAATIAVGTVTTGAAGSSATVTNAGTSGAAVFNFAIPRGDQGIQGIQGNSGWSPTLQIVSDGERRVFQIIDWVGGQGTKPSTTNQFIGAAGIVSTAAAAVDIRGPIGSSTGASWGSITGTLSSQTDLQTALNAKANTADAVLLTGNQTIAGTKTFSSTISGSVTGSAATLTTSRNFSISGGGITAAAVGFNGSAAVALSASVDSGHITLARMANLAANTLIGNNTGSAATPLALTTAQVTAMLDNFTTSLKGLVPPPVTTTGSRYLADDGTWKTISMEAGWNVTATGTGSAQNITIPEAVTAPSVLVFVAGVYQRPALDYLISGTTLSGTFASGHTVSIIKPAGAQGAPGAGANWGNIGGSIASQTDLQAALTAKIDSSRIVASGTGLTGGGDLTTNRTLAIDPSVAAEVRAHAGSKAITPTTVAAASEQITPSGAANWAPDWAGFITANWEVTANRTLSNPTNVVVGTTRLIVISANNTTPRTIVFGTNYRNVPTIADAASNKRYVLTLYAHSATDIFISVGGTF
jgi:hypothetical protein